MNRCGRHRGWIVFGALLAAGLCAVPLGATAVRPAPAPPAPARSLAPLPLATAVRPMFAPPPPDELPASYAWVNLTGGVHPPGRYGASAAYDPAAGRVVMFGGEEPGTDQLFGDTWAYSSGIWRPLCTGGSQAPTCGPEPAPSVRTSMAYDPALGGVVLYDWSAGATWLFHRGQWQALSNAIHPPRQPYVGEIAYDAADGELVLFDDLGTTWEFAHGGWNVSQGVGPGPSPRFGPMLFFDAAIGRLVLTGGVEGGQVLNDTWEFFNDTWTPIPTAAAPSGTFATRYDDSYGYGSALTVEPNGQYAVWGFHELNWSRLTPNGTFEPPATLGPTVVFDGYDGYLLVFGGELATSHGMVAGALSYGLVDRFRVDRLVLSRSAVVVEDPLLVIPLALGGVLPYTYTYPSLPAGGCSSRNVPQIRCVPFQVGTFNVSAVINDGDWGSGVVAATLLVVLPPTPTILATPNPSTAGVPVSFRAVVSGGLPPFTYGWAFGDRDYAHGANVTHAYGRGGSFNVTLTIANATNTAESTGTTVFVNPAPTLTSVFASPNVTDVGLPISFAALLTGGTTPYFFTWQFGVGQGSGVGPTVSYAYTAAGLFRATVWANDTVGASTSATTLVTVHYDPVVQILVTKARYNTTVLLGAALAGGTSPFVYIWTLGDGTVLAGAALSHTYAHPGTFAVTLTVRDAAGYSTTQRIILTVAPQPPPAPPPPFYEEPQNIIVFVGVGALLGGALWLAYRFQGRYGELGRRDDELDLDLDDGIPFPSELPAPTQEY